MQAKHTKKTVIKAFRRLDIAIYIIAMLIMLRFSYSIIANAEFFREENQPNEVEVTREAEISVNETQVQEPIKVIETETYEDLANDPEVLALIQEAQKNGEELVGTAATIVAEQQKEQLEDTNSFAILCETQGQEFDSAVKATGKSQLWEDYKLLCRITQAEAGNQTMVQRQAVASVIINRVGTQGFGNTLKEVVFQKGQFSTAKNGQIIDWTGKVVTFEKVDALTKEAVYRALVLGEDPTEKWLLEESNSLGLDSEKYAEGGALYFFANYLKGKEAEIRQSIRCKVQDGTHIFYKVWG